MATFLRTVKFKKIVPAGDFLQEGPIVEETFIITLRVYQNETHVYI